MTGITGVDVIDNIIAQYVEHKTLTEFFIEQGIEQICEKSNSLFGILRYVLASKTKTLLKITIKHGSFKKFAKNVSDRFPEKFKIFRKFNCSYNWYDKHSCSIQSDNWGHCNCTYPGGFNNLCTEETAILRKTNVSFFGSWSVKEL